MGSLTALLGLLCVIMDGWLVEEAPPAFKQTAL
jgi:hypothetical protein